jgi:hypothetical protein
MTIQRAFIVYRGSSKNLRIERVHRAPTPVKVGVQIKRPGPITDVVDLTVNADGSFELALNDKIVFSARLAVVAGTDRDDQVRQ